MARLQWSLYVLGWNTPRGVILSWDGTTPGESFSPRMEQLQGSHSLLGWNDSRVVNLSWNGTTPGESFCPGMERLQGSHSVLGWNDSRGLILAWDGTTPGESFCPGMERFQRSHSVLGWNDSRGVILSLDGTTPGESFCPGMERLQGSHSIPCSGCAHAGSFFLSAFKAVKGPLSTQKLRHDIGSTVTRSHACVGQSDACSNVPNIRTDNRTHWKRLNILRMRIRIKDIHTLACM